MEERIHVTHILHAPNTVFEPKIRTHKHLHLSGLKAIWLTIPDNHRQKTAVRTMDTNSLRDSLQDALDDVGYSVADVQSEGADYAMET